MFSCLLRHAQPQQAKSLDGLSSIFFTKPSTIHKDIFEFFAFQQILSNQTVPIFLKG